MQNIRTCILFTILVLAPAAQAVAQLSSSGTPWDGAIAESNIAGFSQSTASLNPAIVSGDTMFVIAASYFPDSRGLSGSSTSSVGMIFSVRDRDVMGLSASRYGYQNIYSESSLGLLYSHRFAVTDARDIHAAVRLRYEDQNFGTWYGSNRGASVDLGMKFGLTDLLSIGMSVNDVVMVGNNAISHPPQFDLGIGVQAVTDLQFYGTTELDQDRNLLLRIGAEYLFSTALKFGVGYESLTGSPSAGLEISSGPFRIEASSAKHPELGYSLMFGIRYEK